MSNRRRKRVTYRPSKTNAVFGGIVGGIFVLIGLFVAIPTFGAFGILWTLIAVGITGANLYQAFGKGYVGPEIHIEEENVENFAPPTEERANTAGLDPQKRLEQLETLKKAGLVTQEEYSEKRKEILDEL